MLSLDPPLANPEDMTIPRCVANADEAIAIIRKHPGRWLKSLDHGLIHHRRAANVKVSLLIWLFQNIAGRQKGMRKIKEQSLTLLPPQLEESEKNHQ
jgi:hypothetical protein